MTILTISLLLLLLALLAVYHVQQVAAGKPGFPFVQRLFDMIGQTSTGGGQNAVSDKKGKTLRNDTGEKHHKNTGLKHVLKRPINGKPKAEKAALSKAPSVGAEPAEVKEGFVKAAVQKGVPAKVAVLTRNVGLAEIEQFEASSQGTSSQTQPPADK